MNMARKHYVTVALPEELMDEVDIVVKEKRKGYTSRGEFCKQAVRDLLEKLKR